MKKIKVYFLFCLASFICSCGLYIGTFWWEKRKETVGYIWESRFRFTTGDPTTLVYKYEVGDKEFWGNTSISGWINFPRRQKFVVHYNPDNPKKSSIDIFNPIYMEKNMIKSKAVIVESDYVKSTFHGPYLTFDYEYKVSSTKYTMRNYFYLEDIDSTLTKKSIDKFLNKQVDIEYDVTNPQISRLKLKNLKSVK